VPCRGAEYWRFKVLRWLIPLAALLVCGCLPHPSPLPAPGPLPSGAMLLSRLSAHAGRFQSLRGLAEARVVQADNEQSSTQVILARRPDHLRIEVLGLFGQPALLLVTDGTLLSAYLPAMQRFYQGPLTDASLARFTRLPLSYRQLLALLLGDLPLPAHEHAVVSWEDGAWQLQLQASEGYEQRYAFDEELRLVRADYLHDGVLRLRVDYDEFDVEGFARSMRLALPDAELEASLHFSEVSLNPPLADERFQLVPPAGLQVRPLP